MFDDILSPPDEILEKLEQIKNGLRLLEQEADQNIQYEHLLEMAITEKMQKALQKALEDLDLKRKLWVSLKSWKSKTSSWVSAALNVLSIERMTTEINNFVASIAECAKVLHGSSVIASMKESLDQVHYIVLPCNASQFKVLLPLLQDLKNNAIKSRHWQEIWVAVGTPFPTNDELTVNRILQLNLIKCTISYCYHGEANEIEISFSLSFHNIF